MRRSLLIIFINPYCPFCYLFVKETEKLIKIVDDKIQINLVNIHTQKEEIEKRVGIVLDCVVNQKPIGVFYGKGIILRGSKKMH